MNVVISWLFLMYFAVLGTERIRSLFPVGSGGFFATPFDGYVNLMTVLSLTATLVLLIGFNGGFWRSLFGGAAPNYRVLVITAGVLLLSGMVHTEHTVAPLQFVAYGALILAMILQTVLQVKADGHAASYWLSLCYLVVFHVLEAVTAVALVVCFTFLTVRVFEGNGQNLLLVVPFAIMFVMDAVLIAMRWQETVNWFVLVAGGLATILFLIGRILLPRLS